MPKKASRKSVVAIKQKSHRRHNDSRITVGKWRRWRSNEVIKSKRTKISLKHSSSKRQSFDANQSSLFQVNDGLLKSNRNYDSNQKITTNSFMFNNGYEISATSEKSKPFSRLEKRLIMNNKHAAIAYHYVKVMRSPNRKYWFNKNGVIHKIMKALQLNKKTDYTLVLYVLNNIGNNHKQGKEYIFVKKNRTSKFEKLQEKDKQLICDFIESGISIRNSTLIFNAIRLREGLPEISRKLISNVIIKYKAIKRSVTKIPSGSFDKYSNWCKARKKWSLQLALRFGSIKWEDISDQPPPDEYNINKLDNIDITQVVWWDETHPKCKIGQDYINNKKISFPRNENNIVDINSGSYDVHPTKMTAKYDKELRVSLGVAVVDIQSKIISKKPKEFWYTNKKIVTYSTFNRLIKCQINHIKTYKYEGTNPWIEKDEVEGLFKDDPLNMIKQIGTKKEEMLNQIGIYKVGDLFTFEINDLPKSILPKFKNIYILAKKML